MITEMKKLGIIKNYYTEVRKTTQEVCVYMFTYKPSNICILIY